ncbi:hypothetical protein LJB42_001827 [Komagataella kurtzmanii]|nr:hypothetical protein LJB42_001827 [Komagataella kurtzmanii]
MPIAKPANQVASTITSQHLSDRVLEIQDAFEVSPTKLQQIVAHFVEELKKGLSAKGGNVPMIPVWVLDYPNGTETGDYLAIDLGGTNLRVVLVHLLGGQKFETEQEKYHLPKGMRTTRNRDELFEFIADCLEKFFYKLHPNGIKKGTLLPLGFTFSYPASQTRIDTGVLQRWTKGFDIPNVEGEDVVPLLMDKINLKKLPIKVVALINDTAGALVASRYTDPTTEMGLIFGTGVNGAYYDRVGNIEKLKGKLLPDITDDSPMLINCEYGSFDNEHESLPRTKYDILIDEQSPRPGQQAFEKMTAGYYLGELIRLILVELYEEKQVFQKYSKDSEQIKLLYTPYLLDTSFLAEIEGDQDLENFPEVVRLFQEFLKIEPTLDERRLSRALSEIIGNRSARLSVCGIGAACTKMNIKKCHCAADGSVFHKYPKFPERAADSLADIFGWKEQNIQPKNYPIQIVPSQDGSGVGAAVIAALAHARQAKGLSLGLAEAYKKA